MDRTLEPELLDALPPDHPDAIRNRRDLRLTNLVMRNHAWIARTLSRRLRPGERVLELGAGTGELGQRLARHGLTVDGLDVWPRPPSWPAHHAWHRVDVLAFTGWESYRVVIGNLIFHQFTEADLQRLGRRMQRARMIVACEPARRRASQVAYRTLAPLFGANHVSLHDAHVSIAAGFRGDELPSALGLSRTQWDVHCASTCLGAYHLTAMRR